jgi:uncharacterized protein YkwD
VTGAARLAGLLLAVTAAGAPAAVPPQSPTAAGIEAAVQRRVDAVRREHGLARLRANATAAAIARAHSRRMSREGYFSHRDPGGGSPADRARAAGLAYRVLGENLAEVRDAADPAASAVEGWMASEGHRANILRPEFTESGIGVWQAGGTWLVTQLFLAPR